MTGKTRDVIRVRQVKQETALWYDR